ncbi:hypothetical protein FQR65_LT19594 [Abscondita terminalis]|nr:hypothetical protein FQR65_LT19594 [Abscondita terminalis]
MKCLWDVRCKEYKDLTARNKAYATIADILNISVEIVKKRLGNNLRSTYNQEKKKVLSSQRTGTGTEDVYEPSLPWFSKMRFLDDVITPRKTICSQENSKVSQVSGNETGDNHNETPHSTFLKKRRVTNDHTANKEFDAALKTFKEVCDAESSEFDKFGESIASQLKNMPIKDALELQLELQQIITKRRLKLLENGHISGNNFITPIISESESRPSISLSDRYSNTSRTSTSLSNNLEYAYSPDFEISYEDSGTCTQDSSNAIYIAMEGADILSTQNKF